MDLVTAYAALPRPSAAGSYSVAKSDSNCRVGRSYEGHPAILVALKTDTGAHLPRRLTNFAYHPPTAVTIRSGASVESAQLAIVECRTLERRLASYFFRIAAEVLFPEAESGDEARFEAAIDAVITLFKALQRPAARTIQGLWSELAMIAFAENTQAALSAWHSSGRALHDFVHDQARLEVKSTTRSLREHTFLLDQLELSVEGQVLIASMKLIESSGGCSVFDLVNVIRGKLSSFEACQRLEAIVAECLGNGFESVDEHLFDLDAARESLRLYRGADVPKVPGPIPPEVKEVEFVADLSNTEEISLEDSRRLSAQFRDLLPSK